MNSEDLLDQDEGLTSVHLVLSSGGVKVVSYAGALGVLAEHQISFASVSACSAGSLIGALLCAGLTPQELVKHITEFDFNSFAGDSAWPRVWPLQYLAYLKWPFAAYKNSAIPEIFCKILGGNPTFAELKIPFATAGVDIISKRFLVYSKETAPNMPVSEALKIATALPFILPPYQPPGRIVVDAAMASECPVWMAAEHNDDLPILALQPRKTQVVSHPDSMGEYVSSLIDAGVGSRDYYLISQLPRVRMIKIDCGDIRFDQAKLSKEEKNFLITSGRIAAEEALKTIGDDLSNVPTKPLIKLKGESIDDKAEYHASMMMSKFTRELPKFMRDQVFISYSRKDRDWLERFQVALKPYTRNRALNVWSDSEIRPGTKWKEEIETALDSTKVAVLLVTQNFLASDFIWNEELQYFLKASQKEGLILLWVAVSHTAYEETSLKDYHAANDPSLPLDTLTIPEQNKILVEICKKIKAAITHQGVSSS